MHAGDANTSAGILHITHDQEYSNMTAKGYTGRINEVALGNTAGEGGSRADRQVIGGARAPPFRFFEGSQGNRPVIAHDVFDMEIPLPGNVRPYFDGVMDDPVKWARMRVDKYRAKMITLHMVSTDPNVKDTSVKDACSVIADVLKAVSVPVIIGGSGNPKKDPELLEKAAEVCAGERVLLSSVDPGMDYKRVAKAAVEHGHAVLSLISMNPDEMRRFNKSLRRQGLGSSDIVMDLFTGGIGYGIEYTVSSMERCRLAGLKGDGDLAYPIASATSNAWSAREAWMENPEWGPRDYRGPLWEAGTAVAALLSGADLFMMLHPLAIESIEDAINRLYANGGEKSPDHTDWILTK